MSEAGTRVVNGVPVPQWIAAAARIAVSAGEPTFEVRSQCQGEADLYAEIEAFGTVLNQRDKTHHWAVKAGVVLSSSTGDDVGQVFLRCERTISRMKALAAQYAEANGISVRMGKSFDWSCDAPLVRLDVLYGHKAVKPDLVGRVTG